MTVSIEQAIQNGGDVLCRAGIKDARREATSLLADLLGTDRAHLVAHSEDLLNDSHAKFFQSCIERRANGEPQQYITGHQEFYKLDFEVTPDVLIPRPETEAIVEIGLELLKTDAAPRIADIGTGSGCIAISILKERSDARAVATDMSAAALAVAARNAGRYGVIDRLDLIQADLLDGLSARTQFVLIASNPPYIPDSDWESLPREVRDYEPAKALVAGTDGLNDIRRLLSDAPCFLRAGGHLVFEIGFGQDAAVKEAMDHRMWQLLEIRRDLQEIPRTVVVRKK